MTKRALVFLPCLVALMFVGCSTGGEGGVASKASSPFASVEPDPDTDGLTLGYVSTVASEFTGDPARYAAPATEGLEPGSRRLFQASQASSMQVQPGLVGVSTVVPQGLDKSSIRFNQEATTAKDLGNGRVEVVRGAETAYLVSAQNNGVVHAATVGSDGVAVPAGEDTYPRLVSADGVRGVILAGGSLVVVE